MKTLLATAILLASSSSHADIIKCYFTEPFYTTVYSMTQSKLTTTEALTGKVVYRKNVSFQIKGPGSFELLSLNGQVLQTLTLDYQGSDGMSDKIYPYTVSAPGIGIGGCTSNYHHAY